MLSVVFALVAAASLCWPATRAAARLAALGGRGAPAERTSMGWLGPPGAVGGGVLLSYLALGPAGAVMGALLSRTAFQRWRARRGARARVTAVRGAAEALGNLVAELRSGAHPALAAESVARDATPSVASALRAIAAAARLGGEVDAALVNGAVVGTPLHGTLDRLTRAWTLAQRHGLPLADVLEAARRDLEASARFDGAMHARMAGPRASAAVLGMLPLVGLALGEAMGAQPIEVLASSTGGQVLVLLGGALIWAGVTWSARLTRAAVSS